VPLQDEACITIADSGDSVVPMQIHSNVVLFHSGEVVELAEGFL
jgi:hypothetical protein